MNLRIKKTRFNQPSFSSFHCACKHPAGWSTRIHDQHHGRTKNHARWDRNRSLAASRTASHLEILNRCGLVFQCISGLKDHEIGSSVTCSQNMCHIWLLRYVWWMWRLNKRLSNDCFPRFHTTTWKIKWISIYKLSWPKNMIFRASAGGSQIWCYDIDQLELAALTKQRPGSCYQNADTSKSSSKKPSL